MTAGHHDPTLTPSLEVGATSVATVNGPGPGAAAMTHWQRSVCPSVSEHRTSESPALAAPTRLAGGVSQRD